MKRPLLIAGLFLLFGASAQEKFKKEMVGRLKPEIFTKDAELKQWYEKEYASYQPNEGRALYGDLKAFLKDKKVVVILGTWCSDSQREFPRLMKVLDGIHFPRAKLKIYGVDSKKRLP